MNGAPDNFQAINSSRSKPTNLKQREAYLDYSLALPAVSGSEWLQRKDEDICFEVDLRDRSMAVTLPCPHEFCRLVVVVVVVVGDDYDNGRIGSWSRLSVMMDDNHPSLPSPFLSIDDNQPSPSLSPSFHFCLSLCVYISIGRVCVP